MEVARLISMLPQYSQAFLTDHESSHLQGVAEVDWKAIETSDSREENADLATRKDDTIRFKLGMQEGSQSAIIATCVMRQGESLTARWFMNAIIFALSADGA